MNAATMIELMSPAQAPAVVRAVAVSTSPTWHALWTRSHCEQLVHDQLAAKGFDLFLPTIDQWSRRGGLKHLIRTPMFPGYVFLHGAIDKPTYLEVVKARALVRITRGPMTDVEGVLVRTKPNRGLLVVSVELLRRSVAVHVDCTWVVPA